MIKDVLILGAGPAGMSAATRLLGGDINFSVIEKKDLIGGLAKTINYGQFSLDIGPHILCTKPYVYDFNEKMYHLIEELLGERLINYEAIRQKYLETVHVGENEFAYPIQITNALKNVGLLHSLHMIYDYLGARFQSTNNLDKNPSFEQAITTQLGRSLADLFILNYSKKTWGLPCSNLSSDLAWRVGEFSIMDVLIDQISNFGKNLRSQSGHPVCYPEQGIGLICEQMRANIEEATIGEVKTDSYPVRILHNDGHINEVVVCEQGVIQSYHPKYVLSSIPIGQLIELLDPKPPAEVIESVLSLKHRSHLCLYLIVNKSCVLHEHCIYYPDPEIPFARLMEQKNYSQNTCPDDMTALVVEFFCWYEDEIWNKDDSGLFRVAISKLEELGIVKEDDVADYFVHRERYAYPVYDLEYADRLKTVMTYLVSFSNLKLIGRSGTFTYMGQYRAMESGVIAADTIIHELNKESGVV